jgi:carbonic anhydrase/acetyltransferase-like protein (isoleucine patch superfamily)
MRIVRVILVMIWLWVWPATLAATAVGLLVAAPSLAWHWPWFVWFPFLPVLYLCWLVLFLYFCAPGIRRSGRFPKPRHAVQPGAGRKMVMVGMRGLRGLLISSLPLVPLLRQSEWGRRLVIRAYCPSLNIGKGARIFGTIWDPDLTEVGERAVIGAGATIAAHAWTVLPNGKTVYVTAPVKIGARANVGGGSLVYYGCVIGEDTLIEPMSYLPPFTEVPAGEVWGGRPASFQQKRSHLRKAGAAADPAG